MLLGTFFPSGGVEDGDDGLDDLETGPDLGEVEV
jgi:hypothetical protein